MMTENSDSQKIETEAKSNKALVGQFSKDLLRFLPKESRYSYEADSLLLKFNAAKPIYEYLYRRSDSWNDPRTNGIVDDFGKTLGVVLPKLTESEINCLNEIAINKATVYYKKFRGSQYSGSALDKTRPEKKLTIYLQKRYAERKDVKIFPHIDCVQVFGRSNSLAIHYFSGCLCWKGGSPDLGGLSQLPSHVDLHRLWDFEPENISSSRG
jgi:hypothetical protein